MNGEEGRGKQCNATHQFSTTLINFWVGMEEKRKKSEIKTFTSYLSVDGGLEKWKKSKMKREIGRRGEKNGN